MIPDLLPARLNCKLKCVRQLSAGCLLSGDAEVNKVHRYRSPGDLGASCCVLTSISRPSLLGFWTDLSPSGRAAVKRTMYESQPQCQREPAGFRPRAAISGTALVSARVAVVPRGNKTPQPRADPPRPGHGMRPRLLPVHSNQHLTSTISRPDLRSGGLQRGPGR